MRSLENTVDAVFGNADQVIVSNARAESEGSGFDIDRLNEQQQLRLTHALDEYLQSLEDGTSFDLESFCDDDPELGDALAVYLEKLNSLYGLAGKENAATSIPKTLGEFTLVREIGRGGMGIVYEATQDRAGRSVALKLLPMASTLDARQIARFKNEARAAGALDHPHIVPVYSVGESDGVHFYAMQLIDGEPVDQGISRQLPHRGGEFPQQSERGWEAGDWRTVLGWAADAADALHAAHETGVVHRDIKPSNLMIDKDEKIWITDFGLARIQSGASLTRSGDVIGTMRYMSPEQANGQSAWVDGRSDIYSLAVTVYEMLVLQPAHCGEDGPSLLKAIDQCDVRPIRQVSAALPRDLETVIAKAMSKSRDDRYNTSRDFANDLRRVLDGSPTQARPPSVLDRVCRFAGRHRNVVLVATAIWLLGFIGFAVSTALIASEKRVSDSYAKRAAQSERLSRRAVDRLGAQMAELLSDIPSAAPVRTQLLRETINYYETFAKSAANDPALRADLANTYGKIGTLQSALRADETAIKALRESERLYAQLVSQQPANHDLLLDWSVSQNNLAESLHRAGSFEEGATYFARSVKIQELLMRESPSPEVRTKLATTLNNLGLLLAQSGAEKQAESAYARAVGLLKSDGASSSDSQLLGTVLANLSAMLATDQPNLAIDRAREALMYQSTALEQDRGNAKLVSRVIASLQSLGAACSNADDHFEAIRSFEKAIELGEQLLVRWPDQPQYVRDQVVSWSHLGTAYSKQGKLESARNAFGAALKNQRSLAIRFSSDAESQSMLGGVLNNLGFLHQQLGNVDAARGAYTEAVQCQSRAVSLAPGVKRYQDYLEKHRFNLDQFGQHRLEGGA